MKFYFISVFDQNSFINESLFLIKSTKKQQQIIAQHCERQPEPLKEERKTKKNKLPQEANGIRHERKDGREGQDL